MNAQKGFTLIELMIVVAIIGILAAIAIPQYQNYIAKSQVSRVMGELSGLKTSVETCYLNGEAADCDLGAVQSDLLQGALTDVTQAGSIDGLTVKIETVKTEDTDTAIISGKFGNNAATAIKGDELQWARDSNGTWTCSTNVETKYRPNGCSANLGEAPDPDTNAGS